MNEFKYDWWVDDRDIMDGIVPDGIIFLKCRNTGTSGIVKNPMEAEWQRAFFAPGCPYKWTDGSRVTIIPELTNEQLLKLAETYKPPQSWFESPEEEQSSKGEES